MHFFKNSKVAIVLIVFLLALIPFLWFAPGEMDLGGDSNRLYFYDPINFLKNFSLYAVLPDSVSEIVTPFYFLPFTLLNIAVLSILQSGHNVILLFDILKLTVSFLSIYLIVSELIDGFVPKYSKNMRQAAAILAGLFYTFSPPVIGNWQTALISHNQVFLNPLMFYLLLRYLLTQNARFLWTLLLISFIFAPNFATASAPPFFAFYPLSILFIFSYVIFIRRTKLPLKGLLIGLLCFMGLHSFHFLPTIFDALNSSGSINAAVFSSRDDVIGYFYGVRILGKPSFNIFSFSQVKSFDFLTLIFPFIILFGLLFNSQKQRAILLVATFFLTAFYLVTARIGFIGEQVYILLFHIPGFAMFRNFAGQWSFVYVFFYTILLGLALFALLSRLKIDLFRKIIIILFLLSIVLPAKNFIAGDVVRNFGIPSGDLRIGIKVDKSFEETLSYIPSLEIDGKFLTLPLTGCCFQVVRGETNGTYIGPSMIAYLTGKNDFAGYTKMRAFAQPFLELAKAGNYEMLKQLLSLLNIHYIYYNRDPKIYLETFPEYLYAHLDKFLPTSQKEYQDFVGHIAGEKIFEKGSYQIYAMNGKTYLPHFYIPTIVFPYEDGLRSAYNFSPMQKLGDEVRVVYIGNKTCKMFFAHERCVEDKLEMRNLPKISFKKINPVKYKIHVAESTEPFFLVFSDAYNSNWKVFISPHTSAKERPIKVYFDGMIEESAHKDIFFDRDTFETVGLRAIPEVRHGEVNGYANAWYIKPEDSEGDTEYELIVEMTGQRVFYIGLGITILVLVGFLGWGLKLFVINKGKGVGL